MMSCLECTKVCTAKYVIKSMKSHEVKLYPGGCQIYSKKFSDKSRLIFFRDMNSVFTCEDTKVCVCVGGGGGGHSVCPPDAAMQHSPL